MAKLYTRSIHREAFDQALHDISGEKIDTEVLYTGWVTSGGMISRASIGHTMLTADRADLLNAAVGVSMNSNREYSN